MDENYPVFKLGDLYEGEFYDSQCDVKVPTQLSDEVAKNKLSIFHLNVRSLRKNLNALESLLFKLGMFFYSHYID